MKGFRAAALAAGALVWTACTPPKYVAYESLQKDWLCAVPWGWNVMTEQQGQDFAQINFIGPFHPDFYLGAPSFSIRWHAYDRPRTTPDGLVESFSSADDYMQQMLATVYGPQYRFDVEPHEVRLDNRTRPATHFVVMSAGRADYNATWGVGVDQETGGRINPRKHAYVLLPLQRGFYVLVYPATVSGYPDYEAQFNQLVNSFRPITDGPGGPKLRREAAPTAKPS